MKKTPWFSGDLRPARKGVYERTQSVNTCAYSYWTGRFWATSTNFISDAYREGDPRIAKVFRSNKQNSRWRGLTTKDGK